MRWLYHVTFAADLPGDGPYAPASLQREGFIHCSFRDAVAESARLYFPPEAHLRVLQIDPRRLGTARLEIAPTPRGPMPHVHGVVPRDAIHAVISLADLHDAPDVITP